ncbi:MAG TPA: hypothetical protein PKD90_13240 [Phnomibacter sp.]|nr:hypothetical protein [Phnomibacter sp.]
MKKLFLALAIGCSSLAALAAPTETKVTYRAQQGLMRDFGNIENVTWSSAKNDLLRATFEVDGQTVSAFYSADGQHIGTTVVYQRSELPLRLRMAIDRQLADYTLDEILEYQSESDNAYYLRATKNGESKIFKGTANGTLTQVKKDFLK